MIAIAVDIALVAVFVYFAITWLRRARAHVAMVGLGILGGVYLLATQLGLSLTAWLFQAFFAALLVFIVILFHSELRLALERVGLWGLRRTPADRTTAGAIEQLVTVTAQLSGQRRGALVVLPGRDPVERQVHGGIPLEGQVSEPLLLSLFDPHSPGHDGAVILDGERVRRFAVHLPLSADQLQLKMRGTRHAAALGLAELTDAMCIVVSEETGGISVAVDGRLTRSDNAAELAGLIRRFRQDRFGPMQRQGTGLLQKVRTEWKAGLAALATSTALWLVVIPGSEMAEETREVRPVFFNLPPGYAVERTDPPMLEAVLKGTRRDFFWIGSDPLKVEIDGYYVRQGRRTFQIDVDAVEHPAGVTVDSVSPLKLRLYVRKETDSDGSDGSGEEQAGE